MPFLAQPLYFGRYSERIRNSRNLRGNNQSCRRKRCIEYEKKNGTITEEFQNRKAVEVLESAIKIVKGGGVDLKPECKWKLEEEGNLYVTECENRHLTFDGTPAENGYRYCPYCGRKIKEVD